MFDNKNQNDNQNRPTPPSMNESSDQGQEKEETSQESSKDVYTMPKKFRDTSKSSGGGKKKKIIIIIAAVVVFAGVAVGAAYLFQKLSTPEENKNAVVNNSNDNNNVNANANNNLNTNISSNLEEYSDANSVFSIKYPSNWEANIMNNNTMTFTPSGLDEITLGTVTIEDKSESVSDAESMKDEYLSSEDGSTFNLDSSKESTIDGKESLIISGGGTFNQTEIKGLIAFVVYENTQVMIMYSTEDEISQYEDIFEKSIKSFKLLKDEGSLNLNGNSNTNVNNNANINSSANLNNNINSSTNTNTSTTPLSSTNDDDGDGLTDVEESLWNTGVNTPDTDGDGYIDGKNTLSSGDIVGELYLGYDPTVKDKKLSASDNTEQYTNDTYRWSMLYPSKWTATQMSATTGEKNIMFSPNISTVEYIQVTVEENTSRLSAKNWYLSLNPNINANQLEEIVINGLSGILTPDKTAVYLGKEDKIYLINYNVGNLSEVNYQTTFEMMYQSFKLISSSTSSNQNTNTNSNQNQNINAS